MEQSVSKPQTRKRIREYWSEIKHNRASFILITAYLRACKDNAGLSDKEEKILLKEFVEEIEVWNGVRNRAPLSPRFERLD
jgi:hypothetical protein